MVHKIDQAELNQGQYRLFENKNGGAGVSFDSADKKWSCTLFGMQAFVFPYDKWVDVYDKAIMAPTEEGPFVIVTAGTLRDVGLDVGQWEFGYLSDVTPTDDECLVLLETQMSDYPDYVVVIWIHSCVE